jgi:hypothetical protein
MYFDEMGNVVVCIQLMELYVDIDVINCKLCGNDVFYAGKVSSMKTSHKHLGFLLRCFKFFPSQPLDMC